MHKGYDLVIVGAGPGGLAAASAAKSAGMSVLVLNEQEHIGGQIYHSLENVRGENKPILGEDYLYGKSLLTEFRNCGADYIPGAAVLDVSSNKSVCYIKGDKTYLVKAEHIIISTGAMERPVPVPGWTTPGVMGAASVDVLFKQANVIPSGKVVFAGSGPLLLVVACHLIDNGVKISAILDSSSYLNYAKSMPYLFGALKKTNYLIKGMQMLWKIRRAGVSFLRGAKDIEAVGDDRITSVRYTRNGKTNEIETDLLLLHEGIVPNTQLSRAIGCDHEWYDLHRYWKPVVDEWGRSSVETVSLVGDCSGIYGAKVAEYSGSIAGFDAAFLTGYLSEEERDKAASPFNIARRKEMVIRPFLDSVYRPNKEMIVPRSPETVVCRCEEVTLHDIIGAMEKGYTLPVTVKNETRSGMGRCQGRMCGLTISEILADNLGVSPEKIGYYTIRPMIKPVTVAQLGNMAVAEDRQ